MKAGQKIKGIIFAFIMGGGCLMGVACTKQNIATTIQMKKTEGQVNISEGDSKIILPGENLFLYDGYRIKTAEISYAWFVLDRSRMAKLDQQSAVELKKDGKNLEILMNAGNMFFNINKPLESDETLEIRTSSMIVGIRGTCGWVENTDPEHFRVYLLEGTADCRVEGVNGGESLTDGINGGQVAEMYYPKDKEGAQAELMVHKFSVHDIPDFVLNELLPDEPLCETILNDSGLDIQSLSDEQNNPDMQGDGASDENSRSTEENGSDENSRGTEENGSDEIPNNEDEGNEHAAAETKIQAMDARYKTMLREIYQVYRGEIPEAEASEHTQTFFELQRGDASGTSLADIGFALADLDENGSDELLLSFQRNSLNIICTVNEGVLTIVDSFTYRSSGSVCGTFVFSEGSSGAASYGVSVFRLPYGSSSLEILESISIDNSTEPPTNTLSSGRVISDDEMEQILGQYTSGPEPTWYLLEDYRSLID